MSTITADPVTPDELLATPAPAPQPSTPPPTPPDNPAVSAPPPPEEPAGNPFAGQRDKLGREFHPAKFRLKDGRPQVDSAGRFVPLTLGRPRTGAESNPPASASTPGPKPPPSFIPPDEPAAPEPAAMPIDQMAAEVAINLVQTALILIGKDEGILTDFERKTLHGPLSRILAKYNLGDKMTPELEFAAALAVIVMFRLKKPNTMGWFQGKMFALKNWWTRRKLGAHVHPPTMTPGTHTPAPGPDAARDYLNRHGRQD